MKIEQMLLFAIAQEPMNRYAGAANSIFRTCTKPLEMDAFITGLLKADHAFARYFKQRLILEKLAT